ncbi:MAG: class I SAM-dependent methyltransferase [Gammaproteobacteria bacterium]|nr:class I SAM-dependent methyltransferase [Gammaproteobacteria bacterium]
MSVPQSQADKTRISALFDRLAAGYDHEALRFFAFCADQLVQRLAVSTGQKILDVATGTGAAALTAAQLAGPDGRVIGIDLSEAMLDRAAEKARALGLRNIDLHLMDAESLEFRAGYFDGVMCGFGLFFVSDMARALGEWHRVLRPGGTVVFSAFAPGAFEPLAALFFDRLEREGLMPEGVSRPPVWHRLADLGRCRGLLAGAGFEAVKVDLEPIGYHLAGADQWWDVLWNSGFRALLEGMDLERRSQFRAAHLADIAQTASAQGIRLEVPTLLAHGRKPLAKPAG